jgi:acyl-coenzyme A thioesterase PaaI-like protein
MSLVDDAFVLTVDVNLHLMRPVSAGAVTVVGKLVHRSKNEFVAEAVAYDETGTAVEWRRGSAIS